MIYIKPNSKRINSLINDKTTIDHQLGAWVLNSPISSLDINGLEVVYSIPTGLSDPTIKDINAVHLIDHSGVIVAEIKDISYTGEWEFGALIDAMVDNLPKSGYVIIIESVRGRDGLVANNACTVNSSHFLLAINVAFKNLICFTYEDLPSETYFQIIEDHLEEQARSGEPLVVTLDNGNRYTLKSVSTTGLFQQAYGSSVVVAGTQENQTTKQLG